MRLVVRLWVVILGIIFTWIYFIFISPAIFNNKSVEIPVIEGLSEIEARSILDNLGVKYQIAYVEDDKDEAIKTIPYAGTKIKKNNVITLYMGKVYPSKYKSYLGQSYDEMANEIELMCNNYGLDLKLEFEEVENIISGIIIKESLTDGSILNKGDELVLTISVNNNSYLMPNLVGMHIDEALAEINRLGLKVNLIYYQTPIDPNIILFQSVEANTLVNKNNNYVVDIYVSKLMVSNTNVDVDFLIEAILNLGYDLDINYIKSNEITNKLIAFEVQKLYDISVTKYTIWITE